MAREGYWLNVKTGKALEISEHCVWIQNEKNAKRLRLPKSVYNEIVDLDVIRDRVKILTAVMNAGFVRVRGHGNSISFEFTERSEKALWAIYMFLKSSHLAGPMTNLYIANIRTKESENVRFEDFENRMSEDPQLVLRAAGVEEETLSHIIASLVKEAKRKKA